MNSIKRKLISTFRERLQKQKKDTVSKQNKPLSMRYISFNPNEKSALESDKFLNKDNESNKSNIFSYKSY